jgi:adenylate kinase family enzyme
MPATNLTRIAVVGTSCSGKTTLARSLAGVLGAPHVELDSLYWGPEWQPRSEFRHEVLAAIEQPRWVIDGNYTAVRDDLWRRCTAIVWLDYAFARVLLRALGRTVRRVATGERLYAGNRETIRNQMFDLDGIPWWVIRTHGRRRREIPLLLQRPEYAHAAVLRFRTPAAADAFLAQARANAGAPE